MATPHELTDVFRMPVKSDNLLYCPSCTHNNEARKWLYLMQPRPGIDLEGLACPNCNVIFSEDEFGNGDFDDLLFQNKLVEEAAGMLLRETVEIIEKDSMVLNTDKYRRFLDAHT